jgi:hypothetical protein
VATLADQLHRVEALLSNPELCAAVGDGIVRELRYPISSFRQLFPSCWPGGQKPLL